MIEKFPTAEWIAIRDKWQSRKTRRLQKYFHLHKPCLHRADEIVRVAGLDKSAPRLSVLDISAGFCFFPWLCKQYGHEITITDVDLTEGYIQEVRDLLGMPPCIIFEYPASGFIPLPKDIGTFDVITALQVAPQSLWTRADWECFISDCMKHLNKSGRLVISPNESTGYENLKRLSGIIYFQEVFNCIIITKEK